MKKRILGMLLSFVMCISMLPAQALAAQSGPDEVTVTLEPEVITLSPAETSAQAVSLMTLDETGKVALKDSNEVLWIDRLDLEGAYDSTAFEAYDNNYALGFYNYLVDGCGYERALRDGTTLEYTAVNFTGKAAFTYTGSQDADGAAAYAAISEELEGNWSEALAYLSAVFYAFDRDHSEVFWLSGETMFRQYASYSYSSDGTVTYKQAVCFVLHDEEAGFDIRADIYIMDENLTVDADGISNGISWMEYATSERIAAFEENAGESTYRYDMVCMIHDDLVNRNCYNSSADLNSIDHLCRECYVLEGRTGIMGPVCEGYARAFWYLCSLVDIPCVLVDGYASPDGGYGESHMWNYVQMDDGKWYAVDVTWDDPVVEGVTTAQSGYENRNYFLVGSETEINGVTFAASHPVSNTPAASAPAFTNGPVLSATAYGVSEEGGGEDVTDVVASGTCGENLTWTLDETGLLTISGSGEMENYSDGTAPWYDNRDLITKVVVEEGVESIGTRAFYSCEKIASIEISNSVTFIGESAFFYCYALEEIDLPDGLTSIEYNTFSDCSSLTELVIPDGVTEIGLNAFYRCKELSSIVLPESLISFGGAPFYACYGLTGITIPSSVTTMGFRMFPYCESLSEVTFLGDAPSMESDTFDTITATCYYPAGNDTWTEDVLQNYGGTITWVAYGESAPEIVASGVCGNNLTWTLDETGLLTVSGTGAMADYNGGEAPWYENRASITKVVLEDGVKSIGRSAFYGCSSLTSIKIPEGVTSIDSKAFFYCDSLTDITFTRDAPAIGENAFYNVTATAYYPADKDGWTEFMAQEDLNFGGTITWVAVGDGETGGDCPHANCKGQVTDPTCTEGGYTTYVCSDCGHSYEDDFVDPTGHDWYEKDRIVPTGVSAGELTICCSACEECVFVTLPKFSKLDYEYGVVLEPTFDQDGIGRYTWNNTEYGVFSFDVVLEKLEETVADVSLGHMPSKLVYEIGEKLDITGLELKVTYSSERCEIVSAGDKGIAVSGFDSTTAGEKTVVVTYAGYTVSFTVTVVEAEEPEPDPNAPQIVISGDRVRAGETLEVTVAVKNNPGIASMKLKVAFDPALTLTGIVYNDALGGQFTQPQTMNSPVVLNWVNAFADAEGDWTFATLTFTVAEDAQAGTYPITVTYDPDDLYDMTETNIKFAVQSGIVEIVDYIPGDINGDGKVNNKDATRLLQYLSEWDVEVVEAALDVNGDGKVNNKDATRLLQYLSEWDVEIH